MILLQMYGWYVVSEQMLVYILSVSVDPHEMLWAKAAMALAPLCGDLKPEDLLMPFFCYGLFKK